MKNRSQTSALLNTLFTSVKTGLNASLTPEDCKLLLHLLGPESTDRSASVNELLDQVYYNITSAARTAIENMTDDIVGKPRRKRRK